MPLDQLHIADHKSVVERQRAKRLEAILRLIAQIDAYLGQLHTHTPCKRNEFFIVITPLSEALRSC